MSSGNHPGEEWGNKPRDVRSGEEVKDLTGGLSTQHKPMYTAEEGISTVSIRLACGHDCGAFY